MDRQFTQAAQGVIDGAKVCAWHRRSLYVDGIDILSSLLENDQNGFAGQALSKSGVTLSAMKEQVRQCTYGEGSRIEENAPWTTNAQMVLVEGREIAAELRSDKCGTEHLLLALLRIGGFSVKALVDSGFAPAIISREVMSLCSPPRQARRLGRVWQGGGTSAAMLLHGTRGR